MTVQQDAEIQHFQSQLNSSDDQTIYQKGKTQKMRIQPIKFFSCLVIVVAVLTLPTSMLGQKRTPKGTSEKTLVGFISDVSCGLKHMEGMNERDCTLMCAKNGSFVLADREMKIVYQLDEIGQKKAPEFAGQRVKVRGRLVGKRIRVSSIELAS